MNPAPRASARHRIAGLVLAVVGVGLARLVAPACEPVLRGRLTLAGVMIAASGLFAIAWGVRKRLREEAAAASTV